MSWHFSQALVEAYSAASCSGGEPSAPSKSTTIADASSCSGSATESLSHFQSGTTCEALTVSPGGELLTWFLEAFRARTSALPARAQGLTANGADYGESLHESFVTFDRSTFSWKTRQCSLLAGLDVFSGIWPRWGSMRDGECWALTMPDFLTDEIGYGWPLPTPSGVNGGTTHCMGRIDEWGGSGNPLRGTTIGFLCLPEFEELVMGWPVTWTAPTPFETAKFQRWLALHGIA